MISDVLVIALGVGLGILLAEAISALLVGVVASKVLAWLRKENENAI